MIKKMIPVNEPLFAGNEKKYLNECIDTGWVSSEGKFVSNFEEEFSSYIGTEEGISVSSGTAALETALYAMGIGQGDEVIMPSLTIISCAIACLRRGAVPVLTDIDSETWTLDVSEIENKITSRTKAIMPVHIFGHPVDMDPLFQLQDKYNIKIIEDSAQSHGSQYYSQYKGNKWLKCGNMGDIAAFSFYANKIITTGEGGMVVTNNSEYARKAEEYRNLCFISGRRFYHNELGYNFRMTNLQAALGLAQLEQINRFIEIKKGLGEYYRRGISKIKGIRFMSEKTWADSIYWMNSVEIDPDTDLTAKDVMERLAKHRIGTRPFFTGLHAQPALKRLGLFDDAEYPITEKASRFCLYLPSGLNLLREDIDYIIETLERKILIK